MSGLTRRTFLKAGLAGFSSLALGPPCLLARPGAAGTPREHVSLFTGRHAPGIATTCGMCPAGCGILAYVEEGCLVGLAGNPEHPYNRGALCGLGSAGMNLTASAQRIHKPLRRKRERGGRRWEEITWEEALRELEENFRPLAGREGRGSLVISVPGREATPFVRRFLRAFGRGVLAEADGWDRTVGERVWKACWDAGAGIPDLKNASLVLNFGADPLGNPGQLVGAGRQWAEARGRRARWMTLDPRFSATAARSDRWIPVRPGTDGFVALAIAREILKNGWQDRSFLQSRTDADPDRLWKALREWTPERAALASQVPAGTIAAVAEEFAGTGGAVALFGSGVTDRAGGMEAAQAVLLLNFLTGNIERKGGLRMPPAIRWQEPDPGSLETEVPVAPGTLFWDLEKGNVEARCLLSFQTNPACTDPDCGRTAGMLRDPGKVPYHAAMVTTWNETAELADLVLPAATYLESWNLEEIAGSEPGTAVVCLRQPVLAPPQQSRALEDVLLDLAKRLGGRCEEAFRFDNPRQYYEVLLRQTFGAAGEALSLEGLRAGGWAITPAATGQGARPFRIGHIVDAAASRLAGAREGEGGQDSRKVLILFASPTRGDETSSCKWLAEIDHQDPLWMHPMAAEQCGCGEGDWVLVQGPCGEIRTRIRLTEGLHPGAVAMASWPRDPLPEGRVLAGGDPDKTLVWWEKKAYGGKARGLVPWPSDPHREAPGWTDTVVTVKKTS